MSELQVGQINSTDGSTAITTGADGYVSFAKTQIGGRRNLIINGAMQVAQRGTSATGLTGTAYSTVDRWQTVRGSLGTWTEEQSTDAPDGFSNSLKFTCTTADASPSASDSLLVNHRMEGYTFPSLAYGTSSANSVTLSFWVKSNKTGTYAVGFRNIDNSRAIGGNYTIDSAGTWEYKTFTFVGDTASGFNIDNTVSATIEWFLGAGTDYTSGTMPSTWTATATANRAAGQTVNLADATSNYWQITGVQLEVGTVATPFEHRSYGEELALCQRYYYNHTPKGLDGSTKSSVMNGSVYQTTSFFGVVHFPVSMRSSPTLDFNNAVDNLYRIFQNGGSANCRGSEFAIQRSDVNSIALAAQGFTVGTAGHSGWMETNSASGNVGMCCFDAEL